jgi:hypothetical protein
VKRILVGTAALLLLGVVCLFPVSCSKDREEKGSVEKMTEKAGKDVANKLMAPIDKAKAAKEMQEERDREAAEKMPAK